MTIACEVRRTGSRVISSCEFCGLLFCMGLVLMSVAEIATSRRAEEGQWRKSRNWDHLHLVESSKAEFANQTLVVCVIVREPFVIYNAPIVEDVAPFGQGVAINLSPKLATPGTGKETSRLDPKGQLENYSGIAIEVTKRLVDIFKFKVRVIGPRDGQFGIQGAGGRWTGLLGSLVRNECQLGVTALSITSKRADVVDFTRAYYVETSSILLRSPDEIQNFLVIFEPFSTPVWFSLLATILILILMVAIMTKLEDQQRIQQLVARSMKAKLKLAQRRASSSPTRGHHQHQARLSVDGLARVASLLAAQVLFGNGKRLPDESSTEDTYRSVDLGEKNTTTNSNQNTAHADPGGCAQKRVILRGRSMKIDDRPQTRAHHLESLGARNERSIGNEFGSTWTQRGYYSIACVLNILLNKGNQFILGVIAQIHAASCDD